MLTVFKHLLLISAITPSFLMTGKLGAADLKPNLPTKITGGDELHEADVIVDDGNRLKVQAKIEGGSNPTEPNDFIIYESPYLEKVGSPGVIDFSVNGSSVTKEFEFKPSAGEIFYLEQMTIVLVDSGNSTWLKFMVIPVLTNGLRIQVKTNGTTIDYANPQNNIDLITSFPDSNAGPFNVLDGYMHTGDVFVGSAIFAIPMLLSGDKGDFVKITVRDNLTGLNTASLRLRIWRKT